MATDTELLKIDIVEANCRRGSRDSGWMMQGARQRRWWPRRTPLGRLKNNLLNIRDASSAS